MVILECSRTVCCGICWAEPFLFFVAFRGEIEVQPQYVGVALAGLKLMLDWWRGNNNKED